MVTLDDVHDAAERLQPVLRPTPLEHVHAVGRAAGRDLWVKEEQLQRTGSYKIRGAYNFISRLESGLHVVAASAGNHAQGVALASSLTGHECEVFMPRRASLPKIEATEGYGAHVVLIDGDLEDCVVAARARSEERNAVFVPPFDHPWIVAGQGTLGLELARDMPAEIETVVVPVGGGGLIAGVALALKALRPEVRVVGVEAAGAPTMTRALREGRPITLQKTTTMADAIAMREVSELTLEHVRKYVDEVVAVTEEEISHAMIILLERAKVVVEPGAATSLAAVLAGEIPGNRPACLVLSGGNVDPVLLSKIIDHGLISSGRYFVLRVVIPDNPGQLADITRLVADFGINVVSVDHHRSGHLDANQVIIQMTLEGRHHEQQYELIDELIGRGFFAELID